MYLETDRLIIRDLAESMARDIHFLSVDDENRRFVPDEVFETEEEARSAIRHLISCCQSADGPFVYAVLLHDGRQIGHVQLVKIQKGWEIGFHTGQAYRCRGYATEAVRAFLPAIMDRLGIPVIHGICNAGNLASRKVLEKCGFTLIEEGPGCYQGEIRPVCRYLYYGVSKIEDLLDQLDSRDQVRAYEALKVLEAVSREADWVYPFFERLTSMLNHPSSYIRTRGLALITANARWDKAGRIDGILDSLLEQVADPSPITARQCIKALPLIACHRPALKSKIVKALTSIDLSGRKTSMRGLLEKDIQAALNRLEKECP